MANYKLSRAAAKDFAHLFDYGIDHFGLAVASSYAEKMYICFDKIALSPLHYQAVDDIRDGYRRCVYGSHNIYYRINRDDIEIMRILGQQDPKTSFNN